jgi:LAO/AO transport system kinase
MLVPEAQKICLGNELHIARALSWVENRHPESEKLLKELQGESKVIGITGPPGAGKSTLVNALVSELNELNHRVAILAVDPSSAFNFGSLLGDRLRMQNLFMEEHVFIRSVSSRGSLGGLSAHIIEMVEVLKHAPFDYIIVETVGVGQSEVEIAGIADTTVVVTVPESGDEIQALKSGIMEIADVFVVNKSDREGSDAFVNSLKRASHMKNRDNETPVLKTIASENKGISELISSVDAHLKSSRYNQRRPIILAEKVYSILQESRMKDIHLKDIQRAIEKELNHSQDVNLFRFAEKFNP